MRQVHIMIFVMALCHIGTGILLIVFSSMRMRRWRLWTEQDDPQAYSVLCAHPLLALHCAMLSRERKC